MSSQVKSLIIGVAALVLVAGALIALKVTQPGDSKKSDGSISVTTVEPEGPALFDINYNDIESISVENENGGYNIKRTHKGESDTAVSETAVSDTSDTSQQQPKDATTFSIEELEKYKINDSVLGTFPSNLVSQHAVSLIEENAQDLSKYGLESPKTKAVIKTDGTNAGTTTIWLGDETPAGSNMYIMLNEDKKVYSVSDSVVKLLTYGKEYFVSLTLIDKPETENDYPIVESLTVQRPDLDKDIVLKYDASSADEKKGGTAATHVMVSPVDAYLDVSKSKNYTHAMFGLTATAVLSLSPTPEEMDFAGINAPVCTVTMELEDGEKKVLKIGKQYNDGYTGYFEGTDVLFQFSADSIPWVNMKADDIMSSIIFGTYIYDISSLTVTADDKTLSFEGEGSTADDYKVTLNGKDFDTKRFRDFYQTLIAAPAESICLSEDGIGKLLASVEITDDNGEQTKVEFYETDGRTVLIKKNGKVCFSSRSAYVLKSLIPNVDIAEGTEDFITNW